MNAIRCLRVWPVVVGLGLLVLACKDESGGDANANLADGGSGGVAGQTSEAAAGFDSEASGSGGKAVGPEKGGRALHVKSTEGAYKLAIDAEGNRLAMTLGGFGEVLVRKYDASGKVLATMMAPSAGVPLEVGEGLLGVDLAVDPMGNVYVTANIDGFIEGIPEQPDLTRMQVLVAKYDPDGGAVWARQYGGVPPSSNAPKEIRSNDIAVDGAGNVFVLATSTVPVDGEQNATGNIRFDQPPTFFEYYLRLTVAKYSADGDQLWISRFNADVNDSAAGIDVDAEGNVYVVGVGSVDNVDALFVTKLDQDGTWLATRHFVGDDAVRSSDATSISVSDDGQAIYIGGQSQIDYSDPHFPAIAGDPVMPWRRTTMFVLKLDDQFDPAWGRIVRTDAYPESCSEDPPCPASTSTVDLATDAAGAFVQLLGHAESGTMRKGLGYRQDILAVRFNADGDLLWQRSFASSAATTDYRAQDYAHAGALDPNGEMVMAGSTWGSFGGEALVGPFQDAFFARFTADAGDMVP